MNISVRIFLGIFLLLGISAYAFINTIFKEIRPAIRQTSEDALVDTANLLAVMIAQDMQSNNFSLSRFPNYFESFKSRELNAKIWALSKSKTELKVYITDQTGTVVYHSHNPNEVGKDYSQWNDVYLTLRAQYGVRTTRLNPNDELSTQMHVAAPIKDKDKIIGVLTVIKPNISMQPLIDISRRQVKNKGLMLLMIAAALGLILAYWLTRSIRKLAHYAENISQGERAQPPLVSESELSKLGVAIDNMRKQLDGKDYVENYIHTLTHEMKSPLAAIQGASELLNENMDIAQRQKFLNNILQQTQRLQNIVNRLLQLATVENLQQLENIESINTKQLIDDIINILDIRLSKKNITINNTLNKNTSIKANKFLITQALINLLDNAIEFSPNNSKIQVYDEIGLNHYTFNIQDQGQGIPDFAIEKVFQRFYSLPNPENEQKGSGLGLCLVKEVSELHKGYTCLENTKHSGALARFCISKNL